MVVCFHIYLIFSRCLISIDLPVRPTYDLLHVLHCNLYNPLELNSFCGVLSHNWFIRYYIFETLFKSVLLNRLVTLCMSGM